MYLQFIVTGALVLISFLLNRQKTIKALQIAFKKIKIIAPAFLSMLILVSIVLYLIPEHYISQYLGTSNKVLGMILGLVFGSVALMPGFIAFPLGGLLIEKGVTYMVISVFTTTMMMVGIVTYPIEKQYFGHTVAILRNVLGLVIAVIVALVTGIFFGEVL